MTEIFPASSTAAAFASSATQAKTQARTTLSSDFETFLQMLTAQMENQDPLNPIESSEYAAQLAAFSSVEQQVLTNDLLTALTSQMNTSSLAQLSSWVGMDVRSEAGLRFDGVPQTLHPVPAALADEAYLVVYDHSGAEVQRLEIPPDSAAIEWAGVAPDGTPLANGVYHFAVDSFAAGEGLGLSAVESYQSVTEAQMIDGQVVLALDSGLSILPSNVVALRDPTAVIG